MWQIRDVVEDKLPDAEEIQSTVILSGSLGFRDNKDQSIDFTWCFKRTQPCGRRLANIFVISLTPLGTMTFPPGSPETLPSLLPNISSLTFDRSSPHSTLSTRENPDRAKSTSLNIKEDIEYNPLLDRLFDSKDFLITSKAFLFRPL